MFSKTSKNQKCQVTRLIKDTLNFFLHKIKNIHGLN